MRVGNLKGRAVIITEQGAIDVDRASDGRFGPEPSALYEHWPAFISWAQSADLRAAEPFDETDLRAPSPAPRQVFAIGLNYRDHAAESGQAVPESITVFTKFASSLTGPHGTVTLPAGGNTDWEVELVVVIGIPGRNISAAEAWGHVAGVTVGQDLSERILQMEGASPQFSLAKSFEGFAPTGPWVVTPNELPSPDDVEIGGVLNGEIVQRSRTRELVFSVPQIVEELSKVVELYPGDVIFTGTPAGVGFGLTPPRYLKPGDRLESFVEGVGRLSHTFRSADEGKSGATS